MSDSEFFSKSDFSFSDSFTGIRKIYSSATGHTEVFEARKAFKRFALKALKPEYREDLFYVGMLRKEFEIGYSLDNPGLVHTYSFENVEGLGMCIVLEWIDGITLSEAIKRGSLSNRDWENVMEGLCDAVSYLEARQVVHGDLKPVNIMLTSDGNHVKIIDFGFSDTPEYASLKNSGGTIGYASPEQLKEEVVSTKSDIYALGKIFEELPLKKSSRLRNLIGRMLCEEATRRPGSAAGVKAELIQSFRSKGRKWWLYILLAIGGIGLVIGILIHYEKKTQSEYAEEDTLKEQPDEMSQADEEAEKVNLEEDRLSEKDVIPTPNITLQSGQEEPEKELSPETETTEKNTSEWIIKGSDNRETPNSEKKEVHWMVLLTGQETYLKAKKLRERGDSLWNVNAEKEVREWVNTQIPNEPELRQECYRTIGETLNKIREGK